MGAVLQATAFLLLAAQAAAAPKDPTKAAGTSVPALIEQLGSGSFEEREAASKKLEALGDLAREALDCAAIIHPDLEVKRRAQRLALRLQQRANKHLLGQWHGVSALQDGRAAPRVEFAWSFQFEDDILYWG